MGDINSAYVQPRASETVPNPASPTAPSASTSENLPPPAAATAADEEESVALAQADQVNMLKEQVESRPLLKQQEELEREGSEDGSRRGSASASAGDVVMDGQEGNGEASGGGQAEEAVMIPGDGSGMEGEKEVQQHFTKALLRNDDTELDRLNKVSPLIHPDFGYDRG